MRHSWTPTPSWSMVGVLLGAIGYVCSLTPTLLPRPTSTQVLASTIVVMTMYAIGATGQALVMSIVRLVAGANMTRPAHHRHIRLAATAFAIVIAAAFTPLGMRWQAEQFASTAVPGSPPDALAVVIGTLIASIALLYVGRAFRRLGRAAAAALSSRTRLPSAVSTVAGGFAVAAVVAVMCSAAYAASLVLFNQQNNSVAGQQPPASATRSGSAQSLIPWQTLGNSGRDFVTGGPTPAQISEVTGTPAAEPVRIYAGLESADSLTAQATLAVEDLRRAGGFGRRAIIVYTPSTNGLVDPTAADAAEYVLGGDVASVSMQYTVLPSSLSFVLSKDTSLTAGEILFTTFRQAIDAIPQAQRPRLYVYGESLGAFGSQAPFAGKGLAGLTSQSDGALWAGPPAASEYWRELSAQATAGPSWAPVIDDGRVVRFAATAAGLAEPHSYWGPVRGVFLQNSTDPVVWWSPELIASRPTWLAEPRGPHVPSAMSWFPLISFELVFVDMPAAVTMPPGIGHNYLPDIGPAWISVLQPTGWTPAQTVRLQRALVSARSAQPLT